MNSHITDSYSNGYCRICGYRDVGYESENDRHNIPVVQSPYSATRSPNRTSRRSSRRSQNRTTPRRSSRRSQNHSTRRRRRHSSPRRPTSTRTRRRRRDSDRSTESWLRSLLLLGIDTGSQPGPDAPPSTPVNSSPVVDNPVVDANESGSLDDDDTLSPPDEEDADFLALLALQYGDS